MTFGKALEHLKGGRRVTREGWHGKGAYLYLEKFHHLGFSDGESFAFEPCIVMRTSEGNYQPGWLASQADMLAGDWAVLA